MRRVNVQPFARGQGQAFVDGQPWLGGEIRIIAGPQSLNANFAVKHSLRVIPRFAMVLDAGTATAPSPLPRGSSAWTNADIYLALPALLSGQNVTLWIA